MRIYLDSKRIVNIDGSSSDWQRLPNFLKRINDLKVPPPHFHAIYAEYEELIEIKTLATYAGKLPKAQRNKVIEWAKTKQEYLMQNFQRLNPKL